MWYMLEKNYKCWSKPVGHPKKLFRNCIGFWNSRLG